MNRDPKSGFSLTVSDKLEIVSFLGGNTSVAPCSTKKLIIFVALFIMAILRGHLLISKEFHKPMINMKRKRKPSNNDRYEKKENFIKQ